MVIKYTKCPLKIPTSSTARPPKIGILGLKIYHLATLKYTTSLNSIRFHLNIT
jgi:hypothetical protein